MFNELGDFGFERSKSQAVGFYLSYLLLTVIVAILVAFAIGLVAPEADSFDRGIGIGAVLSAVVSLLVTFFILKAKNLLGTFSAIVLMVAAAGLGLLGGGLLGLTLPSYLTTLSIKSDATHL